MVHYLAVITKHLLTTPDCSERGLKALALTKQGEGMCVVFKLAIFCSYSENALGSKRCMRSVWWILKTLCTLSFY